MRLIDCSLSLFDALSTQNIGQRLRPLPGQITEQRLSYASTSPDGVRHAVRPQGSHHAQSLKRAFVLPFLWEFLFFWTLRLHKLLPAFGRALDVSIQVPELFHGAQGLVVAERKIIHTENLVYFQKCCYSVTRNAHLTV